MSKKTVTSQVAVLLCSKDGERFLAQQLDSINAQTFSSWKVWASDDGSRDGTLSIFNQYASRWAGRLLVQPGPQQGFVANFLFQVCNDQIRAEYYAFCDQDDIWEPEKLARALAWLETVPATEPALYCSRTRLVDENGRDIGLSPLFIKPPGFANALVQSIGGGNTMVFNHSARILLQKVGWEGDAVSHDWLAYLVVTGCGGRIYYDSWPSLRYRQHDTNLVGCNIGLATRLIRIKMLLNGRFQDWNNRNIKVLLRTSHLLTPENRSTLKCWDELRQQPLLPRLARFVRTGLYRQTLAGNLGLLAALICRRI